MNNILKIERTCDIINEETGRYDPYLFNKIKSWIDNYPYPLTDRQCAAAVLTYGYYKNNISYTLIREAEKDIFSRDQEQYIPTLGYEEFLLEQSISIQEIEEA